MATTEQRPRGFVKPSSRLVLFIFLECKLSNSDGHGTAVISSSILTIELEQKPSATSASSISEFSTGLSVLELSSIEDATGCTSSTLTHECEEVNGLQVEELETPSIAFFGVSFLMLKIRRSTNFSPLASTLRQPELWVSN